MIHGSADARPLRGITLRHVHVGADFVSRGYSKSAASVAPWHYDGGQRAGGRQPRVVAPPTLALRDAPRAPRDAPLHLGSRPG